MHPSQFPAIGRYRFQLKLLDAARLPHYPGSTWRGLLGHGLRRAACVTRQPHCQGCLLLSNCAYSRLFETPAPDNNDPRHRNRPHPYTLIISPNPQRQHQAGDRLQFGIHLIGDANQALPYLIHALNLAGQRGLGSRHARFQLQQVEQQQPSNDWRTIYTHNTSLQPLPTSLPPAPASPDTATIQLITPLRLKTHGQLLGSKDLDAMQFIHHLHRRLLDLHRFHGQPPPAATGNHSPELPQPGSLTSHRQLHWHDWTRYSARQRSTLKMGGLLGTITLNGPCLKALWPWLWLGQYTQLGKGTSLGLGRYRLHPTQH